MRPLIFDPNDLQSIKALISEHNKFPDVLFGEDCHGNFISIHISAENITTKTLQENKWTRVKVYWPDGTQEELYEK